MPSTFSFGTFMPSKANSPVGRALQAELGLDGARACSPSSFFGSMMKAVMPLLPLAPVGVGVEQAGVADVRLRDPHLGAVDLPVVALVDARGSSCWRRRSRCSDSVMAKKPSCVPATQPGTYFFFCASVPNLATVSAGPRFCMLNGRRQDAETLAICSAISTDSMKPMPLPPSSSGKRAGEEAELAHLGDAIGAELVLRLLLLRASAQSPPRRIAGPCPGSVAALR